MAIDIFSLLHRNDYVAKEGVILPKDQVDQTVWDSLATDDLLDAATSATSEEHAIKKGAAQIEVLKKAGPLGIILDLGCGYGRLAEQLLPRSTASKTYIGVDSSIKMLRFARERKTDRKDIKTPMHFMYGEIDQIPLKDGSVDTVVVSAVFLHNHKSVTKRSVEEIYRVLKPGGRVFVFSSFPNFHTLMGYQVSLYLLFLSWFGDPYRNGPVRYFTKSEIKKLFKNYQKLQIEPVGFSLLPKRILVLPGFLNRPYKRWLADPFNSFLVKLLPKAMVKALASHLDVISTKAN